MVERLITLFIVRLPSWFRLLVERLKLTLVLYQGSRFGGLSDMGLRMGVRARSSGIV
jgi:hypothetical protein